jgi:hypothetical protein
MIYITLSYRRLWVGHVRVDGTLEEGSRGWSSQKGVGHAHVQATLNSDIGAQNSVVYPFKKNARVGF